MHPLSYFALTFALVMYAESGAAAVHKRDVEPSPIPPLAIPGVSRRIMSDDLRMKKLHDIKGLDTKNIQRTLSGKSPVKLTEFQNNLNEDSDRIMGGQETGENEYPWQVMIIVHAEDTDYLCGGFLVSTKTVITSAECTILSDDITVIAGAHVFDDDTESDRQVHYMIDVLYIGEEPTPFNVAVMEMDGEFDFSTPAVGSVCLTDDEVGAGETVIATGWGVESNYGEYPSVKLMEVELQTITNHECRAITIQNHMNNNNLPTAWPIHNWEMCTDKGEKQICQGDAGGALVKMIGSQYYAVGMSSFGYCHSLYPSGFIRMGYWASYILAYLDSEYDEVNCGMKN